MNAKLYALSCVEMWKYEIDVWRLIKAENLSKQVLMDLKGMTVIELCPELKGIV